MKKNIKKGNDSDSHKQENVDWQKELAAFIDADINKPALHNSYSVDTAIESNKKIIRYTAQKKEVMVNTMEIVFKDNEVAEIKIFIAKENLLYSSSRRLRYVPQKEYNISGKLKVNYVFNTQYEVTGKILQL